MSDSIQTRGTTAQKIFEGLNCESISYEIRVKTNEVDLDGFLAATKGSQLSERARGVFRCAPKNEQSDFHLHVSWRILKKEDFVLATEFVQGAVAPDPGETEPYAEDFMLWVEKFFKAKTPKARIDSFFRYPSSERQSRFPLPIRAAIGHEGNEINIDGITFSLLPKRHGVSKMWLTQRQESVWVTVRAERTFEFMDFDPRRDIEEIRIVLATVLEEKNQ